MRSFFQGYQPDSEEFYDDLEDLLVMSDVGAVTAEKIVQALKKMTWERRFRKGYEAREGLVELLSNMLTVNDASLKLDTTPSVILMVGVNGVGKTTTIGKLAHQFIEQGKKVLLCAGTRSAPRRRSSLASGRSVPARTSCATRRAATLPPSSLTR